MVYYLILSIKSIVHSYICSAKHSFVSHYFREFYIWAAAWAWEYWEVWEVRLWD